MIEFEVTIRESSVGLSASTPGESGRVGGGCGAG